MAAKMDEALANKMMDEGFHCSQCVLFHAAELLGRDSEDALRIASVETGLIMATVALWLRRYIRRLSP